MPASGQKAACPQWPARADRKLQKPAVGVRPGLTEAVRQTAKSRRPPILMIYLYHLSGKQAELSEQAVKSILVFNYVAIFIYAAILLSIYYRKMFKGIENRAFLHVIWFCLASTILDISMYWSFVLIPRFSFGLAVAHIVTYSYLFVRQFIMFTYIILIFIQTDSIFKLPTPEKVWKGPC